MAAQLAFSSAATAQQQGFADWLEDLRAEARRQGISAQTLETALSGVQPLERVIELDRRQREFTWTFQRYRDAIVSPQRIEAGRRKLAEHGPLLHEVGRRYGVQPRFIVALWGIETNYGRTTGGYPVISALATLAYDGRRSSFFRQQLLHALRILEEGHITAERMTGSWAGAMGQSQFMPESFVKLAVDYDGDGRRDIWDTEADVFASAANYLASTGWRDDQTWGREVMLPAGFDTARSGLDHSAPLPQWQAWGVRRLGGGPLPTRPLEASLILPEQGVREPAFLTYGNFRRIRRWNPSNYFALAVGLLSDALVEER